MSLQTLEKPAALTPQEWESIKLLYAAIDQHNWKLLDDAVTSDWADLPPAPGQKPGPDGVKPVLQGIVDAMPDLRVTLEEAIAEQHRVAVRATIHGTHKGPLFGIPPTGRKVSLALHEFHSLRAGKIFQTRHMEDWLGLFMRIGAFPENHNGDKP